MERIKFLYGASGHCKVIIEILNDNNVFIDGIFDDYPKTENLLGIPILQSALIPPTSTPSEIIVSIGDNRVRKKIVSKIEIPFFLAIHKSAILSPNSTIGKGSVVMAGVIINSSVSIGEHCIINSGSVIEHDCKINNFSHISPNVSLAGNVTVGEGTQIGIGACVIQGVKIGKWVTIGGGSVIIRDVPDFAVVVGNPGKIIKYKELNE